MTTSVRSMKSLWSLITSSVSLTAQDGAEVEKYGRQTIQGVIFYRKPSFSSAQNLQQQKLPPMIPEFITKLSAYLDLDEIQSLELLKSFLTEEFRGSQTEFKVGLKNEQFIQQLLVQLWSHYHSERLSCLLSLKYILSHWQDKTHPNQDLFEGFMETFSKNGFLCSSLISQLQAVTMTTASTAPQWIDGSHWALACLQEQSEVLQCLLLYFKDLECSPDTFLTLLKAFQSHSFGRRQPRHHQFDDRCQVLQKTISLLEGLLIIENLELDWLFEAEERGGIDGYTLKQDVGIWKDIQTSMDGLGSLREHAPPMLAWLLARHLLCTPCPVTYGACALRHEVFAFLVEGLELVKSCGIISTVVHTLVYELAAILLSVFHESAIGRSINHVTRLTACVSKFSNIATDFWKRGLETGCGLVVTSALHRFPEDFVPFLELMTSLASASPDSCQKVVSLVQNLPSYSEVLDSSTAHDIQPGDEDNVWILLRRRILFGTETLCLPAMTVGTMLPERGSSIIRWQTPINGWQLFLRHLDLFSQQVSLGQDHVTPDSLERVKLIYRLVLQVLESNPELGSKLQHITEMVFPLTQRLCVLSNPDPDLLALCLDVMSSDIKHRDSVGDVWTKLSNSRLLSYNSATKETSDVNPGLLDHILQSREVMQGSFPVTSAFLKLLTQTLQRDCSDVQAVILVALGYVTRHVFSMCYRWRYERPEDRDVIVQGCLQVFHLVLDSSKEQNSNLQQVCIDSLLTGEGCHVINDILRTMNSTPSSTDVSSPAVRCTQMALSVLNRAVRLHQSGRGSAPFLVSAHLVTSAVQHALNNYDVRISTLATLLLNRFAKEEGILLLSCLGPLAEPLKMSYLQRLESPREHVHVKVTILEFLTVCVDRQPGVIEMFMAPELASGEDDLVKCTPKDCLKIVLHIFTDRKQVEPQLFTSTVEFLQAVWKSRRVTIIKSCREHPNLWSDLLSPLTAANQTIDVRLCSFLFRIVAMETHYQTIASGSSDYGFKDVVKRLSLTLPHWSKFVHSQSLTDISSRDLTSLLSSWKELLLVLAVDSPSIIRSDHKDYIVTDFLSSLLRMSEHPGNTRTSILSEFLLAISSIWTINVTESKLEDLGRSLTLLTAEDERINMRTMLAVLAALVRVIQGIPDSEIHNVTSQLTSFISPVCSFLRACLIDQDRLQSSDQFVLLPVLCVSVLRHLVMSVTDPTRWLPIFKEHSTLPGIISILTSCLQTGQGRLLASSILSLLVSMATYPQVAECLSLSGLMDQVCLPLANVHSFKVSGWRAVLTDYLTLTTVMLKSLKHLYLESTLDFTGVHIDYLLQTLFDIRNNFVQCEEAITTLNFINELVEYKTLWRIRHPESYRSCLNGVCCVLQTSVAYLLRPVLVLRILESISDGPTANKRIRRLSSTEEVEKLTPELVSAQSRLLHVLSLCLCILRKLSPDLALLLSQQGPDCESWELLVQTSFATPCPEQDVPISFGTLVAAVNVSLRMLTKGERAPSPAKLTSSESTQPYDRQKLVFILENSVTVLLSQAVLSMRVTSLPSRDKLQLARELSAELDLFVQSITRLVRRALTSPVGGLSATNQNASLCDQPFIKLLCVVVNKLFK